MIARDQMHELLVCRCASEIRRRRTKLSVDRETFVFFILAFAFIQIFIGLNYEEFDGYGYLMVKALAIVHFKRKRQERKRKVRKKEWVKREKKLKGKEV